MRNITKLLLPATASACKTVIVPIRSRGWGKIVLQELLAFVAHLPVAHRIALLSKVAEVEVAVLNVFMIRIVRPGIVKTIIVQFLPYSATSKMAISCVDQEGAAGATVLSAKRPATAVSAKCNAPSMKPAARGVSPRRREAVEEAEVVGTGRAKSKGVK